jgi:hypothetical protein
VIERENMIESQVEFGSADTRCRHAIRDKSGMVGINMPYAACPGVPLADANAP